MIPLNASMQWSIFRRFASSYDFDPALQPVFIGILENKKFQGRIPILGNSTLKLNPVGDRTEVAAPRAYFLTQFNMRRVAAAA